MLAIGRALMQNPRVLLMDEPSEGLAPQIVAEVMATIRKLKESGLSIVLVEQNPEARLRHRRRHRDPQHRAGRGGRRPRPSSTATASICASISECFESHATVMAGASRRGIQSSQTIEIECRDDNGYWIIRFRG